MKSLARLLLLVAVSCFYSLANADEINSPVMVDQVFTDSSAMPKTLPESRQQDLSFVFITSDIVPDQEMKVQLAPGLSDLHITRNEAGELKISFDDSFPAELRNVSLVEEQDDYFELQVRGWNTASYPYSLVKAQIISNTGKSPAVQFSNPNYALIKIQSDKTLPQWLSKSNESHSLAEWYGFLFQGITLKTTQTVQISVSFQRVINGVVLTEPILLIPATVYSDEMAARLDSEISDWFKNQAIAKEDIWITTDLTVFEQNEDLEFPVYTLNGVDLKGENVK